jgi:hypothetical protein
MALSPSTIDRIRESQLAQDAAAQLTKAASPYLGLSHYLRSAFLEPYNLILFGGGLLAGVVTLLPLVVWPVVGALELLYLFAVGGNPRYQAIVRVRGRQTAAPVAAPGGGVTAQQLTAGLSAERQQRFENVRRRCADLQRALRAGTGTVTNPGQMQDMLLESSQQDSINQLLWVFLRTLAFEQVLDAFVSNMPHRELETTLTRTKTALDDPTTSDKMKDAHRENLQVLEQRLANLKQAEENREVIQARLVRVENSILLIQEQAVTRQDPGFIEQQVSAVTAGLSSVQEMVSAMDLPQISTTPEGPLPDLLNAPVMALPPVPAAMAARPAVRQR